MQNMVEALVAARPLIGGQVAGILHDHDGAPVAARVLADRTDLLVGQVLADLAEHHMFLGIFDRVREMVDAGRRHSDDMKGQPLCRLIADSRQGRQFLDQFVDISRIQIHLFT